MTLRILHSNGSSTAKGVLGTYMRILPPPKRWGDGLTGPGKNNNF
jgi:hypothetical protein